MAKITDYTLLNLGTEILIDEQNKTIELVETGNLSSDGVTLEAVYLFCLTDYEFLDYPIYKITDGMFDLINDWNFKNDSTKNLIRDGGWSLRDNNSNSLEEYMCFISTGSLLETEQIYYQQSLNGESVNCINTGHVNQPIKIYGDINHGNIDYRNYFKCFIRTYGRTFASNTIENVSNLPITFKPYYFYLQTFEDPNIIHTNEDIEALEPFIGMNIEYLSSPGLYDVGGELYEFSIVIDANQGSLMEIYEYVQYYLRNNKTKDTLVTFNNNYLYTETGVYIDDFLIDDINYFKFKDTSSTIRNFSYITTIILSFNDILINDPYSKYWIYFKNNFGTINGELVKDIYNNMTNNITQNIHTHKFNYDDNVQKEIIIVASGLETASYTRLEGVIIKNDINIFYLESMLEKNYSDLPLD